MRLRRYIVSQAVVAGESSVMAQHGMARHGSRQENGRGQQVVCRLAGRVGSE